MIEERKEVKEVDDNYSWINFKLDKRLHVKFSMILKLKGLSLREVMSDLVKEYALRHGPSVIAMLDEKN